MFVGLCHERPMEGSCGGIQEEPKSVWGHQHRKVPWFSNIMHVAIYAGQTHFVTSLLDRMEKEEFTRILSMQNSKGNTPLHLAAELGNLKICRSITGREPDLISSRNMEGETPLFLAANYGQKDAFICLRGYLNNKDDCSLCRRINGDTILHCTIYGEFFG